MARGILRLCSYRNHKLQLNSQRWFSSEWLCIKIKWNLPQVWANEKKIGLIVESSAVCEKNAKPSESIQGIPYKQLKIGVGKEKWIDEKRCVIATKIAQFKWDEIRREINGSHIFIFTYRVALTPVVTAALVKKGFTVNIEEGAGFAAKFRDDDFAKAGANIVNSNAALSSDIILKVRQPHDSDIPLLRDNSTLISFLYPARNKTLIDKLSAKNMNAFGTLMEMIFFYFVSNCSLFDSSFLFLDWNDGRATTLTLFECDEYMNKCERQNWKMNPSNVIVLWFQQWIAFHVFHEHRYSSHTRWPLIEFIILSYLNRCSMP